MTEFTWVSFTNYDQKEKIEMENNNNLRKNPNHLVEIGVFDNFQKSWLDCLSKRYVTHIMFPIEKVNLLQDLNSSYLKKDIFSQFLIDVKRSKLYINGHLVNNIEDAVAYLQLKYSSNICEKIYLLCTQAIFGFILEKLQFSVCELNYYIFETKLTFHKKLKIYLYPEENKIHFKITKILRVVKLDSCNDKTIKNFKILLEYDLFQGKFENLVVNIYS